MQTILSDQPELALLPGETAYSFAARFHLLSGANTPAATGKLLFGYDRAGMHHDFTGHLECLSSQMALDEPRELVLRHTMLPVYLPYHSAARCENWIERLRAGPPSSIKAEMGLLASRFGASHPLKACSQCAEQDLAAFGTSYWRVEHQLPGVTACRKHQLTLLISPLKVSGQDRFAWLLPTDARLQTPRKLYASKLALSLAEISTGLWNLPVEFEFDQEILRQAYLAAAYSSGLADSKTQRFDLHAFRARVSEVIERSNLAEFDPWLAANEAGELLVSRFLRMLHSGNPRQMRHPLNHMILILVLFAEWSTFWTEYRRSLLHQTNEVGASCIDLTPLREPKLRSDARCRLMKIVKSGSSASAAAMLIGISTNTAIAWLAAEGISTSVRPKVLLPPLRRRACLRLQSGEDKATVARAIGVSIQSITRLLFAEPRLHEHWQAARFAAAQAKARKEWTRSMQSCPNAASNEWRLLAPAAYAWLYRNDRSWLSDLIRNRNVPVRRRSARVNWLLRDLRLHTSILEAVRLGVDSDRPLAPYSVVELCTLVPLLKRHLDNLGLLPRTLGVIAFLCRRRSPSTTKSLPIL